MTKQQINRAIKSLGVEIQNQRGAGYSYFTSITTGDQIGESVYVCYLNQQTLEQWVADAQRALKEHNESLSEMSGVDMESIKLVHR